MKSFTNHSYKAILLFVFTVLITFGTIPTELSAQALENDGIKSLSLADLLNMKITTASKIAESFEDAPGIISVITKKEIQQMGARGIVDVLNMIPGFTTGAWLAASSIYVRGAYSSGYSNSILLLVNGKRFNEVLRGSAMYRVDFPVENIKQIEIVRGPGSALYGANAFLAVINIITETSSDIDGVEVAYRGGSHNSHYASAKFGKEVNKNFAFTVHGNFTNYKNLKLPIKNFSLFPDGMPFLPPPYNQTGIPFTTNDGADYYQLYSLEGNFQYKEFAANVKIGSSDWQHGGAAGVQTLENGEESFSGPVTKQLHFGVEYKRDFSDELKLNTYFTYTNFDDEFTTAGANYPQFAFLSSGSSEGNTIARTNANSYNSEVYVEWLPNQRHKVVTGINLQRDDGYGKIFETTVRDSNGSFIGNSDPYFVYNNLDKKNRNIYALFSQYTLKASKQLSITAGMRADKYSDFGWTVNPRIAAILKPVERVSLKALYGQAFRAPSFFEQYLSVPQYAVPLGPNLNPEIIRTYEAQVIYKPWSKLVFSTNVFAYNITDVIRFLRTPDPGDFPSLSQFVNSGKQRAFGFETEIRFIPSNKFSMFANYATADSRDELKGIETEVAAVPRHSINAGFNFNFVQKISFNVGLNHRSDWLPKPAEEEFFGIKLLNALELPNYTLLNLHLNLHNLAQFLDPVSFTFDIFNILDEKMIFADPSLVTQPSGIPKGGRQVLVGMKIDF